VLEICRSLSDEQLDQELGIDHGTVRASLVHLVEAVEMWTDLMAGQPIRWQTTASDSQPSIESLTRRYEQASADFAAQARRLQADGRLDEMFVDTWQNRRKAFGAGIVHVITHSMAHRTHVLAMLDRLGLPDLPEGDALGWERRLRGGWPPAE
jgi:uncharacterized damage-inducible protein DinB